ncbi:damage-inducible protein DinB [Duganella sp. FT80W]|uniref:Damage-inducible protein DinB n=1 Tax=Duganella guangzhouensis TaxID=2666084 RepID=A0A6I2L0P5_9BURK|nr:DinB family protein [Duganella guangzhouensis]MRW91290.1 damage-inducible protein DinB [Duganella guangzhouensis]
MPTIANHLNLLARYNADMNRQLYDAAAQLPAGELTADRKAFFGSVAGTLNHLLAGDTIWLKRFSTHPADFPALRAMQALAQPSGLTHFFGDDIATLRAHREQLDAIILDWAPQITAADLEHTFEYRNTRGDLFRKHFGSVVLHFFNHQTHHRGQASTLLTQADIDIGITDLLVWVPDL